MNKIKGKALSLVLSLALVISSFSAVPASAATKTLNGDLSGNDKDSIYLVNGGDKDGLVYKNFGTYVSDDPVLKTPDHEEASDVHIAAISHASGDRLVKWYDDADEKKGSIDSDTEDGDIALALRSGTVSGEEKLNILYKGTYTDDDDKEITVKATQTFTVRVYDKNETVIGLAERDGVPNKKGELGDDFAQKTAAYELAKIAADKIEDKTAKAAALANAASLTDNKDLTVLKAIPSDNPVVVEWKALKTTKYNKDAKDDDLKNGQVYYQLDVTGNNVELDAGKTHPESASIDVDAPAEGKEDSTPTLTFDEENQAITVKAPKAIANDYTFKYAVNGKAAQEVKNGAISGLATGDKVEVTAYEGSKLVEGSATSFTYTAKVSGVDTMVKVDATATTPGLELKDGKIVVTPIDGKTYTYVYTTDGNAPTKTSDPVTGNEIAADFDAATTIKVAAIDAGGIVTDSTATGSFVVGVDTPASIGTPSNVKFATLAAKDDDVTVVNVVKGTMKYKVADGAETAIADGATISTAGLADGTKITVKAYDAADATLATATATYNATYAGGDAANYVTARVSVKANTGKITITAKPTEFAKSQNTSKAEELHSTNDVKVKSAVDKKIKVTEADNVADFSKYSTSTYLFKGSVDKVTYKDAIKVNGYEVNFDDDANNIDVKVDDKASVTKISGTVKSITVSDGNVGSISLSNTGIPSVTVSDAKVGDIDFGDNHGKLDVNSNDASVGNVTDASEVNITNGTVGNVSADGKVDVSAEDEDHTVSVGDITAQTISVDSDNSKVSVGALKASDEDSEITLSGSFVTVKSIDFDNYNVELKLDAFDGSIPAPKNAAKDGATISTNATEDKVIINGDADINAISVGDDSQMFFDGKLNVGSIDGSGTLVVGLNKMNIKSDASGVTLKFSDPTLKVGDTAFTAVSDTVDEESMENFGFTLSKSAGSKTDTFKIASTKFVGVAFSKVSTEIAKGYSEIFQATPYAPGTTLPANYKVQYSLEGGDTDVFELVDNKNGTVSVKVVDYDKDFAEENKTVLKAEVVDVDGDVDDDYTAGEIDITALAVPKVAYTSDTAVKAMKVGDTYRFRITSAAGTQPKNFAVASNGATVTYRGNSAKDYFYDVKAAKVGSYGVYVDGTKVAVLNITNAYSIDTKTVSVNAGKSYQFKVTGPTLPTFTVAGIGNIKAASTSGKDYFFKVTVPANLAKGGHGVYVNGVVLSVLTVK